MLKRPQKVPANLNRSNKLMRVQKDFIEFVNVKKKKFRSMHFYPTCLLQKALLLVNLHMGVNPLTVQSMKMMSYF